MPGTQADSSLSYTFIEMPICEDGYMFNKKMTVTFENSAPWLWEVPVLVILHFLMEIWVLLCSLHLFLLLYVLSNLHERR